MSDVHAVIMYTPGFRRPCDGRFPFAVARGRIMTISIAPYNRYRYSPNSRSNSGGPINKIEPSTTPGRLPMPPTMINARTLIETTN
jgi:hypothetical protein